MSCPTVIRVTTAQGPPGIGLPAGTADAGKYVRKAGSTAYAYELVTPDAIGLPQSLAPTDSPTFAGLTLSGLAANGLLFTGTGGLLTRLPLGSGLSIVGGQLTATGTGATDLGYDPATRLLTSSTGADVTLPLFSSTAAGLVGASGGGTTTFLRADGTWAAPSGGGATNLSYDPATRTVASSTGGDAVLTLADGVNAGLMSSSDYLKLLSLTFGVLPVPVRNNSGATIPKGTPVYVTGSSGTRITIAPADASLEATAARTLGLTSAEIPNNSDGTVIAVGELTGLNTSTLTEGQIIWLSETTGGMTTTRPTQPAHGVVLGYCVKQGAGTSGIIYIKVDNGLELNELHDVLITGTATGQALMLAADGLWKNRLLVAADLSDSSASGRTVLTGTAAQGRSALQLGSAAQAATTDFATSAQGSLAATAVQPSDARLTDAREWSAATISQAEAEAGTGTTRLAFTAQRVFQAVAAWWSGYSSTVGKALATAVDAAAGRTAIGAEQSGAAAAAQTFAIQRGNHTGTQLWGTITGTPTTLAGYGITDALTAAAAATTYQPLSANLTALGANGTAYYLSRGNHTGTQAASTISDFTSAARATVSATGSLSYNPATGVFSYTAPTPFDPASPGAIGGTTAAAGTFTAGSFTQSLLLPSSAPGTPAAGHLHRNGDTLRYRDSGAVERLLLNAQDNLANLANAATARINLGAAASGAIGSSGLTMAPVRLLGRTTAGTGAPEEISVAGATLSGGVLTITASGTSPPAGQILTAALFT